jgi:CRP/FNR family transcriptional regulator, anaerobic regulatory protein
MAQPALTRSKSRIRLPEIRARAFDREKDSGAKIENLLSRGQQNRFRAIATVLEYQRAGSTIFSEGEDAHFIYSVNSGVVRISRYSDSGRRQVLALMLPGDLFGFPQGGRYVNSAITASSASLYRVPWERLRELLLHEPEMHLNMLIRVAFDLREAQRRIMILGQQNIGQRLASFLIDFSQHPDFYDERKRLLTLPLTRFDLGDYLGSAPETVARDFAKLEQLGAIRRISPRLIEIPSIEALRNVVGGRRRAGNGKRLDP